jgi:hypothetical protein
MFQQAGDRANLVSQAGKCSGQVSRRRYGQNLLQISNLHNSHGQLGTCSVKVLRGGLQKQGVCPDQRFASADNELTGHCRRLVATHGLPPLLGEIAWLTIVWLRACESTL